MEKQIQFYGKTEQGIFCRPLLGPNGHFEKVAGAAPFSDWNTGEEIRRVIGSLTATDRKENAYVLVNALGAGEYFGSNINSDYFGWDVLTHKGTDYGYETFLNANAFQHHVNKDPTRAFGKPIWVGLNTLMKRVELIVRVNRHKAEIESAGGVISKLDAGEFIDVSMGCHVPFDVCSICSHKSKTRADYCEHMRPPPEKMGLYGPNKILPDGRRIFVYNTLPRFFDISFVFIGADKTAKVMAKLASKGNVVCLGDICTVPRPSAEVAELLKTSSAAPQMVKTASVEDCCQPCAVIKEAFTKNSEELKLSEIVKEIPASNIVSSRLPDIEANEPELSSSSISSLSELPLPTILSGLLGLGALLKPVEFQRLVLTKMGDDDLRDSLDRSNSVFKDNPVAQDMKLDNDISGSANKVLPIVNSVIKDRTSFGPSFKVRVVIIKSSNNSLPTPNKIEHPLLDKIGAAYTGYRIAALEKLSQAAQVVESDPKLREAIMGDGLVTMFSKNSSSEPIADIDSVAYTLGAYLQDRGLFLTKLASDKVSVANKSLLTGKSA